MNRRLITGWTAVAALGVGWMVLDPPRDPAAPSYVYDVTEQVTERLTVTSPDDPRVIVVPESVAWGIECGAGYTLADSGRVCEPLPTPRPAPRPAPRLLPPVVQEWEDGSYRRADGSSGCWPWGACND